MGKRKVGEITPGSDLAKLTHQARIFNDAICEQEGYDPVGVGWLLRELVEAYELGRASVTKSAS